MENTEKEIAESIVKTSGLSTAKLGLRFDKVVLRLLATLRAATEPVMPGDKTMVLTLTAPIKHPAKTAQELEAVIKALLKTAHPGRDHPCTVFQNEVQLRLVKVASRQKHKLIGLVHNPGTDAGLLLDLATQWLLHPEIQ